MRIEPFSLHVDDAAIDDLNQRLARTRLPDAPAEAGWSLGAERSTLHDIIAYWKDRFDWRQQEAALNAFPQIMADLPQGRIHALHVPGKGPNPRPLLLCHGWPGSVFEFLELIPRLTDPARFGGDAADAFTVVAPSLPGFGLSFNPGQRYGCEEMADVLAALMQGLGYPRYLVQGGDWGGFIAGRMAYAYADRLMGAHFNLLPVRRDLTASETQSDEERDYLKALAFWMRTETGYQAIQGTKPQTLAFALNDSPAGLAAWIVEKFHAWSDHDGRIESAISRDRMLGNIALYWFTGAIGSSFYPYFARLNRPWPIPPGETVSIPVAYADFPKEMLHPPRSLAARTFTNIRRWSVMPRGGHFAALEQPDLLAEDVRAFARGL